MKSDTVILASNRPRPFNNYDEITQSYLITAARYNFSVYEKRVLYTLFAMAQEDLRGKKIGTRIKINKSQWDDKVITMSLKEFGCLKDGNRNYGRIKDAFKRLLQSVIERHYKGEGRSEFYPALHQANFEWKKGWVSFKIAPELYEEALNFAQGFTTYDLKTACSFSSATTMRLYEMTATLKQPLKISIDELRKRFCLEKVYEKNANFVRRIIASAQKEIEKSNALSYFTFQVEKQRGAITHVWLYPEKRDYSKRGISLAKSQNLRNEINADWGRTAEAMVERLKDATGMGKSYWYPLKKILQASQQHITMEDWLRIERGLKLARNKLAYVKAALTNNYQLCLDE